MVEYACSESLSTDRLNKIEKFWKPVSISKWPLRRVIRGGDCPRPSETEKTDALHDHRQIAARDRKHCAAAGNVRGDGQVQPVARRCRHPPGSGRADRIQRR